RGTTYRARCQSTTLSATPSRNRHSERSLPAFLCHPSRLLRRMADAVEESLFDVARGNIFIPREILRLRFAPAQSAGNPNPRETPLRMTTVLRRLRRAVLVVEAQGFLALSEVEGIPAKIRRREAPSIAQFRPQHVFLQLSPHLDAHSRIHARRSRRPPPHARVARLRLRLPESRRSDFHFKIDRGRRHRPPRNGLTRPPNLRNVPPNRPRRRRPP